MSVAWQDIVQTPFGLGTRDPHMHEETKYNGEFSGSLVIVSDGEWNRDNPFKIQTPIPSRRYVVLVTEPDARLCPILAEVESPIIITRSTVTPYNITEDFILSGAGSSAGTVQYSFSPNMTPGNPAAYTFPNLNYTTFTVNAVKPGVEDCENTIEYKTEYCDLVRISGVPATVQRNASIDIASWFTVGTNIDTSFTATWGGNTVVITSPYTFTQAADTEVLITLQDNQIAECHRTVEVEVTEDPTPPEGNIPIDWVFTLDPESPGGGDANVIGSFTIEVNGRKVVRLAGVGDIGTIYVSEGDTVSIRTTTPAYIPNAVRTCYITVERNGAYLETATGTNAVTLGFTVSPGSNYFTIDSYANSNA
jgi:hypothetical protein